MVTKKRSIGNGGITFDKDRNAYRTYITTPDGTRLFKRFKEEADAIEWKSTQLHHIHKGTFVQPADITIGEWMIEWLTTYKKDTIKQRTYERYTSLAKHVMAIADYKLQETKPLQVQHFYKSLSPQLSACTIAKVHKLLKDMYNKALELELIQKNIMTIVKPPKFEKKEVETFTLAELDTILSSCKNDAVLKKYYPIILLAATTGMRLGEVLGLQWCDVNFFDSTVYIRKSLQQSSALGLILETPKTKTSIRRIKVTQECIDELKALKSHAKNIDHKQETLCFITRNGTPIAPRNFERVWQLLLDSNHANIDYKNFHVLRHTHATELLGAGIPLSDVAKRLGHSKQAHTLELYAHAMPNHDEIITNAIQKLYVVK